jgi:hypothetical protein
MLSPGAKVVALTFAIDFQGALVLHPLLASFPDGEM